METQECKRDVDNERQPFNNKKDNEISQSSTAVKTQNIAANDNLLSHTNLSHRSDSDSRIHDEYHSGEKDRDTETSKQEVVVSNMSVVRSQGMTNTLSSKDKKTEFVNKPPNLVCGGNKVHPTESLALVQV